jgi:hypothetical protein
MEDEEAEGVKGKAKEYASAAMRASPKRSRPHLSL